MSRPIMALKRASQAVRLAMETRLRSQGVTPAQFEVLKLLLLPDRDTPWPADGLDQRAIQAQLQIASATLTRLLAGMERRELISRSPNLEDSRGKRVNPSPKAKKLFADLMKEGEALSARIFRGFSKTEVAALTRLLERLAENLADLR